MKKIDFVHLLHFGKFLYTVVLFVINLRWIHPNECVVFAAKLYRRIRDFLAKSDKYIFQRRLQHKLGLKWKSYTIYTIRN